MSTKPAQPKKKFNFIYLLIAIIILVILVNSMSDSKGPTSIDYPKFQELIGQKTGTALDDPKFYDDDEKDGEDIIGNQIAAVVLRGNTFYILLKTNSLASTNGGLSEFYSSPSKGDYTLWAQYPSKVEDLILAQRNSGNRAIDYKPRTVPADILDQIMPFLYIGATIFLGFIIFKSFSSRGGLGNMGRNRATMTIDSPIRFHDVAGIEEEKEEVQEIVQFLRNPRKFLDLGARIPKGFLLVGSPGTGKTLLAKAIAGEARVPFFSISGSDFSEMLVGVGPSRMRDLFEQAKLYAPSIIFIDEIDSIARMRGVGVSGVSDENEQTLNQLLVQMDGFTKSEGVIVLAATNRPDVLDQALLRPGRFDRQIIVQMPDVKGREKILQVHCKNKPVSSDVDLKRVAQIISGFSGADIENLMNESAIIAAKKEKKKITMQDITEGINKVLLGPQKRSRIITEQDKKITAYHEAGHAVVSRVLQKDQVVQEVSIIPRGMAAGYTLTNDAKEESHHRSRSFLNTQLAVYMSGRVAEELFIGDICTGSSNDLKVATGLAEKMVTSFGMSEKLGPMYYGKDEEIALRMYNDKHLSEQLQSTIDSEVRTLIMNSEKAAKDILKEHKDKVETMTQILLERETIYADDIALIMEGKKKEAVVAEMEKREVRSREQESKDRIEGEIEVIEREKKLTLEMARAFLEAKIIDEKKIEKLNANFELAIDATKKGNRPKSLPTLDNLDNYANLIETLAVKETKDDGTTATESTKPKAKRTTAKKK